jgi:GNAT superfamily N-acetyltransferase
MAPMPEAEEITFRPITEEDLPLLHRIYASTREEELAQTGWDDAQKAAFLDMQFHAQHTFYQEHYGDSTFEIILRRGEPAGRLYVRRSEDEILIVDIALLPEHRNQGIGTRLLRELLDEAAAAGKPVHIHVEFFNPAQRLYQRLGFRQVEDHGIYHLMEWRSEAGGPVS